MKLIYNTSMPRSGSELLQVLLHQNPRIYGSTTSPLLEYQFAARGNYELPEVKSQSPEIMQRAFLAMCKSMAEGYYSEITDRPIVCDKNRGWSHYYEWVHQWNPEPRMICMVRDLRNVIASMERIYRKNRHLPTGPDNPSQLQNMTVGQRAEYWLNTQPVGLALMRTADLFQRDVAKNILFVRYEDLCNNPHSTMDQVYKYIGEEPYEHNFSEIKKEVAETSGHFGVYGDHSVQGAIKPAEQNSWTEVLPKEIGAKIRLQYGWFFDTFNY